MAHAVDQAVTYDPVRGVRTTAAFLAVVPVEAGLAELEGFPTREELEELWDRAVPGTPLSRTAMTALYRGLGGEMRRWQADVLVRLLPQGSPAREALESTLVQVDLLELADQLP